MNVILTKKYLTDTTVSGNEDYIRIAKRAKKIVSDNQIRSNFCTLIWARNSEGLGLGHARYICQLLQGVDYQPRLVAQCGGATVFASNDDFFDVNPSLFPRNEFVLVNLIDGCVNVSNTTPGGRTRSVGNSNIVRFAVGVAVSVPLAPWETLDMFPEFGTIAVEGTSLGGVPSEPDSDADEKDMSATRFVICQSKSAADLRTILKGRQYVKTCELLRHSGDDRHWSTFMTLPSGLGTEEMNTLLRSRHYFQLTTAELCSSSMSMDGRTAIVQCSQRLTYLKSYPTALDLLSLFNAGKENAPRVIPVGDFYFKVLFPMIVAALALLASSALLT
jgi:hypothetical protein